MQKICIKRFFECLIPVTVCNLKCSYCYVIQRDYRNMKLCELKYSPEYIGKCLTQKRLGGPCFFSICGAGETLVQPEVVDIAHELLKNGHIVNITTNGTLTNRFKEFENFLPEELERLHFSFSFHYLELKRLNLIETFFENVKFIKKIGSSMLVQLNLCDDYLPYLDEIKKICKENIGAYPQIAATRKESYGLKKVQLYTDMSEEEYVSKGREFESELFEYTMQNFNVKRKEFCYAGERSGTLDLDTGALRKCYGDTKPQMIFENPTEPIKFEAIGKYCRSSFCFNSSHFMSLGVIDNGDCRTYCGLRDRPEAGWFNETVKYALSRKLSETNGPYSIINKCKINIKQFYIKSTYKIWCYLNKIKKIILER